METKLANFKLPVELITKIEEISEGNKTATVIDLLNQAIAMREIPINERHVMYSMLKRHNYKVDNDKMHDPIYSRNLIDGLWI